DDRSLCESRHSHHPIFGISGEAERAGLDDQTLEPPLPAELLRVLASERVELLFVAEKPSGPAKDIPCLRGTRLHIGQHRIGGEELGAAQHPHELRLAVWPHGTNKGPTFEVWRHGRLPAVVDVIAAAQIDVAAVLLMRAPPICSSVEDLKQVDVDGAP